MARERSHGTTALRAWLIALRVLQVLLAIVATAMTAWAVALYAKGVAETRAELAKPGYHGSSSYSTTPMASVSTSYGQSWDVSDLSTYDREELEATQDMLIIVLVVAGILCAVSLLTLLLTFVWCIYTASKSARSRATCCSDHSPCQHYTCDLAWDIVLLLIWTVLFAGSIIVAVFWRRYTLMSVPTRWVVVNAFCGVMWLLLLLTSILSGVMQKQLKHNEKCGKQPYMDPYGPFAAHAVQMHPGPGKDAVLPIYNAA